MMPSTDQHKCKVDKNTHSQYVYKMINGIRMDSAKDFEVKLFTNFFQRLTVNTFFKIFISGWF